MNVIVPSLVDKVCTMLLFACCVYISTYWHQKSPGQPHSHPLCWVYWQCNQFCFWESYFSQMQSLPWCHVCWGTQFHQIFTLFYHYQQAPLWVHPYLWRPDAGWHVRCHIYFRKKTGVKKTDSGLVDVVIEGEGLTVSLYFLFLIWNSTYLSVVGHCILSLLIKIGPWSSRLTP
jgi:hypothetical protein